jgi:hypothetical protein
MRTNPGGKFGQHDLNGDPPRRPGAIEEDKDVLLREKAHSKFSPEASEFRGVKSIKMNYLDSRAVHITIANANPA